MNVITLKLSPAQAQGLYQKYQSYAVTPPAYALFQLRLSQCVITCYSSYKVVFQGSMANLYASDFMEEKETQKEQAGSDEVGTGDYFGPVVVCAAYVKEDTYDTLVSLGIKDSKQLSDETMLEIGEKIEGLVPHSTLVVSPSKYNQVHQRYHLNAIKALLHNQAYLNLSKKVVLPSLKVVDQFAKEELYYSYLRDQKEVMGGLTFQTKAENQYLAVACASVLARYAFLKYWQAMEEEYHMTFIKGASAKVDACGQAFKDTYGMDALAKVAKLHFQNTKRLI